jgi:Uma2 family endonuclease
MVQTAVDLAVPDPMHLEGWEEQDEPLASDPHSDEQAYCFTALRYLLNPDGHYVAMDRWLRMDPADEHDLLLPDLLIARDLRARQWGVNQYLPWEVGKAPEVLAEFLSPTSKDADQKDKPRRYAELGVREYFLFDPDGSFGVPRIQGWTLHQDGSRTALARREDGSVVSGVLPVAFRLVDDHIGVVDTRTGQLALRYEEAQALLRREIEARFRAVEAQRQAEQAQRQAEQARREEAEARAAAEQAQRREGQARREAEAEAARLRAALERLRHGGPEDEAE